jgi:hypothetical protein
MARTARSGWRAPNWLAVGVALLVLTATAAASGTPRPASRTSGGTGTSNPSFACSGRLHREPTPNYGSLTIDFNSVAAVGSDEVMAVGATTNDYGTLDTRIERWTAGTWSVVPVTGSQPYALNAVDVWGGQDVWIAGSHFSGGQQRPFVGVGTDQTIGALGGVPPGSDGGAVMNAIRALGPDDVWTAGYRIDPNGVDLAWALHDVGSVWKAYTLPAPTGSTGQVITALQANSSTDVWAVGRTTDAAGVDGILIEHWDGSSWSLSPTPDVGTEGSELAGVASGGTNDVWAVGQSTSAGVPRTLALHWDGTGWSVVPTPNVGKGRKVLTSVAEAVTDDVWAVGSSASSGQDEPLSLRWDGTTWSNVRVPLTGDGPNDPRAVSAVSTGQVWMAGDAVNTMYGLRPLFGAWDGAAWNMDRSADPTAGGVLVGVSGVASDDAWAVGVTGLLPFSERWDGRRWSLVPLPQPPEGGIPIAVADVAPGDAWILAYGGGTDLTEHWDGTAWSVVPFPDAGVSKWVSGSGPSDAWVVGLQEVDGALVTLAEHWDGSAWQVVPTPNPDGAHSSDTLAGVSALAPDDAWAVGERYYYQSRRDEALIEHWDGTTWTVSSPPAELRRALLTSVVARASDDVWAVGERGNIDFNTFTPLVIHWDGFAWHVIPTPDERKTASVFTSVTAVGTDHAWVLGHDFGGAPFADRWDGTAFQRVPVSASYFLRSVSGTPSGEVWFAGYEWSTAKTAMLAACGA